MLSPEIIRGPRLKVQRANQHLAELIARTDPFDPSLYSIKLDYAIQPPRVYPEKSILVYRPEEPIPETFALIIGDVIHNLRAALDHLASAIVRTINPTAKPYFPVRKARQDLIAAGDLAAIEAALPGAKALMLDQVRPENDARDHLWAFGSLDIDDKHNLILPTVTLCEIRNLNFDAGSKFQNAQISLDASYPQVLAVADGKLTLHNQPEAIVSVKFGNGFAFENEPVIPTLTQISGIVSNTLDKFEALIRQTA